MIPYSRQSISRKDIKTVSKVLNSKLITQGKIVKQFEKKIAKIVDAKFSVAMNSATSALHVACLALDLKKGDNLWTCSNTFVASANCGRFCGANIDFVDIDPLTWNISVSALEKKLIFAKKKKILPKIIVIVHFAGQPADLEKIYHLKKKYKFKIIEDASHALGAKIGNKNIGSCQFSEVTVFSFHPVKIITTAEGGAAVTNDRKTFKKIKIFMNQGITRDINEMKKKIKSHWYYEQTQLGYNYRMNEVQAALGLSQLKMLKNFVKKRNEIATFYKKHFKNTGIICQKILNNNYSSYHLFVIQFSNIQNKNIYDQIYKYFIKKKIAVNLHYLPVHKQPYYSNLRKYENLEEAEKYSESSFSIPIYYNLLLKDQIQVVKIVKTITKKFKL